MEIGEILGYIISFVGGGGIMSIINWKSSKKKADIEVKVDEIKALHDTIEQVYEPLIKQQRDRINELQDEVQSLRKQLSEERADRQKELDLMNRRILAITSALGMQSEKHIRDVKSGRFVKADASNEEE